jgi:hypothetical protein
MDFVSMDATPPSRDELAQRLAVTYEHATVGIAESMPKAGACA